MANGEGGSTFVLDLLASLGLGLHVHIEAGQATGIRDR
jgi:hypothetical protein